MLFIPARGFAGAYWLERQYAAVFPVSRLYGIWIARGKPGTGLLPEKQIDDQYRLQGRSV